MFAYCDCAYVRAYSVVESGDYSFADVYVFRCYEASGVVFVCYVCVREESSYVYGDKVSSVRSTVIYCRFCLCF